MFVVIDYYEHTWTVHFLPLKCKIQLMIDILSHDFDENLEI